MKKVAWSYSSTTLPAWAAWMSAHVTTVPASSALPPIAKVNRGIASAMIVLDGANSSFFAASAGRVEARRIKDEIEECGLTLDVLMMRSISSQWSKPRAVAAAWR